MEEELKALLIRHLPEWLTALSTVGLMFVTIVLALSTRTAANAARDSAEALPKLERAYLFEQVEQLEGFGILEARVNINGEAIAKFTIKLTNYGKTPAIITSLVAGADHFTNNSDPVSPFKGFDPPYGWLASRIEAELILRPGDSHEVEVEDVIPLDPATIELIKGPGGTLKVYGCVRYKDIFDRPHETAWHWQYAGFSNSFAPLRVKGRDLNYQT